MARYLGLDWDHQQLRVVEASVQAGVVKIRRALAWTETISPNPADAEAAGARLKQRLNEAGIAPAPVLACVGRDRVIIRDIRYPDVPAEEVASVIQFQTVKELAFQQEEAVIDYAMIGIAGPGGEKRALAVILRRELLTAYKDTCRAAGLRLDGLTARPFAIAAGRDAKDETEPQAMLMTANGSGEFGVVRRGELLFSRSLTGGNGNGINLVPELRRSLAAYHSQFPQHLVKTLHVAGEHPDLPELATALQLQVIAYDPVGSAAAPGLSPEERGAFAGAAGIVQARANQRRLTVDFLAVKESRPRTNPLKLRVIAVAAVVLLLVSAAGAWYASAAASRSDTLKELTAEKARLQQQITAMGDVDRQAEALDRWANAEMVMADELYDLNARFPDMPGVRILGVAWTPTAPAPEPSRTTPARPATGTANAATPSINKDAPKIIGQLRVDATGDSQEALENLKYALEAAPQWKLAVWDDKSKPPQVTATLTVFRIEPRDYENVPLASPSRSSDSGRRDRRGPPGGFFNPGGRP